MRTTTQVLAVFLAIPLHSAYAEPNWTRITPDAAELESLMGTEWYGIYMSGKKVGWAQITWKRIEEKQSTRIAQELIMKLKLKSLGAVQNLDMRQISEFESSPPYRFLRIEETSTDGKDTDRLTIEPSKDGLQVQRRTGNNVDQKTLGPMDYTLGDEASADLWIRRRPKVNESITTRTFDTEKLEITPQEHTLLATKTVPREGVSIEVDEVQTHLVADKMKVVCHYDAKTGDLLSGNIAGVELRSEPEAAAKNVKASADLFQLGTVKVDRRLGDPGSIATLTLEANVRQPAPISSAPRQSVERLGDNRIRIVNGPTENVRATPEEIKEALAESADVPISNPTIRELAERAVGDAKTDRDKVERIVAFVAGFIEPSYTANPLNVLVLMQKRKGDCSEYASLTACLARAAGVPCREITGLLYMGDEIQRFGPHAWNEVVIDGVWTPVDASQNQMELDPTHIRFGSDLPSSLSAVDGRIERLKVIEIKRR